MIKLFSANFLRLRKSRVFWVCMALCIVMGALAVLGEFRFQVSHGADLSVPDVAKYKALLEGQFFMYATFIGVLAAALIALFLGTEYSDGAIRNKIVAGHTRVVIYFANLITGFAASFLCMSGYMLSCLTVGVPLLGWFTKPAPLLLWAIAGSVVMLAAFCAVFILVTMNCSKKSTAVTVCLLGAFALLLLAVYIYGRLEAPEFVTGYALSVNGEIAQSVPEPNPHYLRGMERAVYQFFYDVLPTGQSLQYTMLSFTAPVKLMVLSAAVTVVFTGAGAMLFKRKDLK